MYEKASNWLSLLERFVNLIRPKAYNAIAKIVVYTGIALIVESQINFIHALVVALFEEFIGKSELLRQVLVATNDPSFGVFLVVCGMVYHLLVTLGKDFIEVKKDALPKYPEFQVSFSTKDKPRQINEIYFNKPKYVLQPDIKIPVYKPKEIKISEEKASIYKALKMHSMGGVDRENKIYTNTSLYTDRANILCTWSGFEALQLHVSNKGKIFAKGVRLHLVIPKSEALSIKLSTTGFPDKPQKTFSPMRMVLQARRHDDEKILNIHDKLKFKENDVNYEINWNVESLQAGTYITGNKKIFAKVDEPIEISCTIYCDELAKPSNSIITLMPTEQQTVISLNDILSDDKFDKLYEASLSSFENN